MSSPRSKANPGFGHPLARIGLRRRRRRRGLFIPSDRPLPTLDSFFICLTHPGGGEGKKGDQIVIVEPIEERDRRTTVV